MNFNEFVTLCNNNAGFIQTILAFFSLLISIIAIIISIVTARLPYKKKILLTSGSYIGIGYTDDGIHINATNIGNRNIYIKNFAISLGKKMNLQKLEPIDLKDGILHPGETVTIYYSSKDLKKYEKKGNRFYAYFEDNEKTKKYKFIYKVKE